MSDYLHYLALTVAWAAAVGGGFGAFFGIIGAVVSGIDDEPLLRKRIVLLALLIIMFLLSVPYLASQGVFNRA